MTAKLPYEEFSVYESPAPRDGDYRLRPPPQYRSNFRATVRGLINYRESIYEETIPQNRKYSTPSKPPAYEDLESPCSGCSGSLATDIFGPTLEPGPSTPKYRGGWSDPPAYSSIPQAYPPPTYQWRQTRPESMGWEDTSRAGSHRQPSYGSYSSMEGTCGAAPSFDEDDFDPNGVYSDVFNSPLFKPRQYR